MAEVVVFSSPLGSKQVFPPSFLSDFLFLFNVKMLNFEWCNFKDDVIQKHPFLIKLQLIATVNNWGGGSKKMLLAKSTHEF